MAHSGSFLELGYGSAEKHFGHGLEEVCEQERERESAKERN